jgi:hypothetical protein
MYRSTGHSSYNYRCIETQADQSHGLVNIIPDFDNFGLKQIDDASIFMGFKSQADVTR